MKTRGLVFEGAKFWSPDAVAPPASLPDASRFGNHGVLSHGAGGSTDPAWARLPMGLWVMDFDADEEHYVDCGTDESLNFGTGDFTLEAWVNTSVFIYEMIISKKQTTLHFYFLEVEGLGRIQFELGHQYPVDAALARSTTVVNDGKWHQAIGLRRSGTIYVHVDGGASEDDAPANFNIDNTEPLRIGNVQTLNYFDGRIALPRLYNYALSPDQINKMFEAERRFFGV